MFAIDEILLFVLLITVNYRLQQTVLPVTALAWARPAPVSARS